MVSTVRLAIAVPKGGNRVLMAGLLVLVSITASGKLGMRYCKISADSTLIGEASLPRLKFYHSEVLLSDGHVT